MLQLDELLVYLASEKGSYQALLIEAEKERNAIIHADRNRIEDIGVRKKQIYEQMKTLEADRQTMVLLLCHQFNINLSEFSLTNLSELVKEPYPDLIRAECQAIAELVQRLSEANRTNVYLIEKFLDLIRGSLDMLNQLTAVDRRYSRNGKIQDDMRHGRMVSEIG